MLSELWWGKASNVSQLTTEKEMEERDVRSGKEHFTLIVSIL
jgi:hypothetical protein